MTTSQNSTTKAPTKSEMRTQLKALESQRSEATTPGRKAALTKRANELRVELGLPIPMKKVMALEASQENIATLEAEREQAQGAGRKAALTRQIKAMQAQLA